MARAEVAAMAVAEVVGAEVARVKVVRTGSHV